MMQNTSETDGDRANQNGVRVKRTASQRLAAFLLLGIVIGVAMRWVFPGADPPLSRQTGAYWWDEVWSIGARNGAVFGAWQQDEYNPWVVCPLHTALVHLFLKTFGVNPFGLRFLAMAGGTASIALMFFQARMVGFTKLAGLFGAFAVAASWTLTGFSRSMTLEPSLMLFIHLSITFAIAGEWSRRLRVVWYALAGAAAGCAVLCKTSGAVFVVTMVLALVACPTVDTVAVAWRWRVVRSITFGAASVAAFAAGFYYWAGGFKDTFTSIAFDTMLYDRADTPFWMRLYKAITWLDSQAFLASPWIIAAVLLMLPVLLVLVARGTRVTPPMQRFAFWLCLTNVVLGIAILVNVDVPARRLVYLNLFLAPIAGLAFDWLRVMRPPVDSSSTASYSAYRVWSAACCLLAGLVLSGWLVSPHGGLLSQVDPALASRILFSMPLKVADKACWLALGIALGAILYRYREDLWRRAGQVLVWSAVAQLAVYVAASGLWLARMSYSVQRASQGVEEIAGREEYVLGGDGAALCFDNTTRALFWTPKAIPYTNVDVDLIERKYDPHFLVITELMWNDISAGVYGDQPYARTFNQEVARFPIYEIHESRTLGGAILVLRRDGETPMAGRAPTIQ